MSSEMDKLELYLKENGFDYERITGEKPLSFGKFDQIRCGEWDAVCHNESYGGKEGLLETYGMPEDNGDVTGWLTADDVIKRIAPPKVYVVMMHRRGEENPYFQCIFSKRERAEEYCGRINRNSLSPNVWADFISEEVR